MHIELIKLNNKSKTERLYFKNKTELCEFLKNLQTEDKEQLEIINKIKNNRIVSLTDIYLAFSKNYYIGFGKI